MIDLMYRILAKDAASDVFKDVAKGAGESFTSVEQSAATSSTAVGRHWWNRVGATGPGSVTGATVAAGHGLNLMGGLAMKAGVALGGLAFAKVAGEGVQMAMTLEQTRQGFETMLGSGEKAERFVNRMSDFAAKTPFEFPELAGAARQMLAFGFNASEVLPIMTSVGDAVGALGRGSEGIDRVVIALGQMKAKGRVSAEEMMQLTEVGLPAWDLLAAKIGVSVPEAMKRAEKGQIDLNVALDGIIDGMGKKYAGGMADQAKTVSGMLSTLKDNVGMALAQIVEPFFPMIKSAIGWASTFAGEAGGAIKGAMERIMPVVGRFFGFLSDAGDRIMPKLAEYWARLRGAFEDARPGLEAIGGAFVTLGKFLVEKVIPAFIDIAGTILPAVVRAFGEVGKWVPTVLAGFIGFSATAIKTLGGLFDFVLAGVEMMLRAASHLPGSWGDKFGRAADAVEGFRDRTKASIDGAVSSMEGAKETLARLGEEARKPKDVKLGVEIREGMARISEIKKELDDPDLTKDRRAALKAENKELRASVAEAKAQLAEIEKTRTATLKVDKSSVPGDVNSAQATVDTFRGKTERLSVDRTTVWPTVAAAQGSVDTFRGKTVDARVDRTTVYPTITAAQGSVDLFRGKTVDARVDRTSVYPTVHAAQETVNSFEGKNVPVTVHVGYRFTAVDKSKLPPWLGGTANIWGGRDDDDDDGGRLGGNGLLAATNGHGTLGARFAQWGPNWSWNRTGRLGMHDGADVSIGYGAPAYATRPGTMTFHGWSASRAWAGLHAIWRADTGTQFIYAHLSSVIPHGRVNRGTMIGRVGSTGTNSSGPHLHVQASRDGRYVNPAYYLAEGGIVRRTPGGVLAVLGEGRHDEAVIPLDDRTRRLEQRPAEVHFHLHNPVIGSREDLARYITEAQLDYKRRRGSELGLS